MTEIEEALRSSEKCKASLREHRLVYRLHMAKDAIESTVLRLIPEDLVCYPPSEVNPEGGPLVHHIIDSHVMSLLEDLEPFLKEVEAFLGAQQEGGDIIRDLMTHHLNPKKD